MNNAKLFVLLILCAGLAGCGAGTSAVFESLRYIVPRNGDVSSVRLNPAFRYLKATIVGRPAILALGYVENHPKGPIEVWYSAEREVVRTQNGRIVGAVGLTTEWRDVILPPLPPWSKLARNEGAFRWQRIRDVMPGYRFGIRDSLVLRVTAPPFESALEQVDPKSLIWFEEQTETNPGTAAEDVLPAARYAVTIGNGVETVVYGEQCLARELCFAWQLWPATGKSSGKQ